MREFIGLSVRAGTHDGLAKGDQFWIKEEDNITTARRPRAARALREARRRGLAPRKDGRKTGHGRGRWNVFAITEATWIGHISLARPSPFASPASLSLHPLPRTPF